MSTKIYDAYRFTLPEERDLISFAKAIEAAHFERTLQRYYEEIACQLRAAAEALPIFKAVSPEDYYALRDDIFEKAIGSSLDPESKSMTKEEILEGYAPMDLALMAADKIFRLEGDRCMAKMAILAIPGRENGYLAIASGSSFAGFVESLADSGHPVAKAHLMRDYHYQNQTDKPDDIPDAEWDERKRTWDEAMPSGVPSIDGMVVDICDYMRFSLRAANRIYAEPDSPFANERNEAVRSYLEKTPYENRLAKYALTVAFTRYRAEHPDKKNDPVSLYTQFDRELEDEDSRAKKLIKLAKQDIGPRMLDFGGPPGIDKIDRAGRKFEFSRAFEPLRLG